jgi:hypothetical protein
VKQKVIKYLIYFFLASMLASAFLSIYGEANDKIIRPQLSARSAGMGGVVFTTGLYEENFFGNPARVTANPQRKLQLADTTIATSLTFLLNARSIIKQRKDESKLVKFLGDKSGKNFHFRTQTSFPAFYDQLKHFNLGVSLNLTSTQFETRFRRNYTVEGIGIFDIGPALTLGRKFFSEPDSPIGEISIGITTLLGYRFSATEGYGITDYLQGRSFSATDNAGEGAHIDWNIGITHKLPFRLVDNLEVFSALSLNQLLGGGYDLIAFRPLQTECNGGDQCLPIEQNRTLNLGLAGRWLSPLWKFEETVFAFEIQNIGNNKDGSVFRLLHLGAEGRISQRFLFRLGLYQGYLSAGFGLKINQFNLDIATHAEELSLNAGGYGDRTQAIRLSFEL